MGSRTCRDADRRVLSGPKCGHRIEAAAGGMSGGKRNHEDLSDMMALVEAACQAPAEWVPRSFLTLCEPHKVALGALEGE